MITTKKVAFAVVGLIALFTIVPVLWVWASIYLPENVAFVDAPPRGDSVLSEFYTVPEDLPGQPGILLRQQPLTSPAVLSQAGTNIQLLYSSTEGLGGELINPVSATLYLPSGEPPTAGWPLLVWSHGTVGIGDVCAPSFAGRGERDRRYLNAWLADGYAVAASDYQGLGTPGTHPYMDARTMAYNNLDLIRAVRAEAFPVSKQLIISGQSQGATGALATASYARSYAPEIDIHGIIATGIPYFSLSVALDLAAKSDRDEVSTSLPLSLYMLAFAEMLDPDFRLGEIVSETAKPIVERMDQTCVFDFFEDTEKAGLSVNNTFNARPDLSLMKVFSRATVPDIGVDIPIFAGSGTADKITPYAMQQEYYGDACAAGAKITRTTYEGANHNQGLLESIPDAQRFAERVFSHDGVVNSCE